MPAEPYTVRPGKARITARGKDVTLVGISYMQLECLRAQHYLEDVGVSGRGHRSDLAGAARHRHDRRVGRARPGRLCVVDNGWTTCGASAEIVAQVMERLQGHAQHPRPRMGFAPVTCPTSPPLEAEFYPDARRIAAACNDLVQGKPQGWLPEERPELKDIEFKGPF